MSKQGAQKAAEMLGRDLETAEQRQTDRARGSHIPKWFKIIRETESKRRGFQLGGPYLPIMPLCLSGRIGVRWGAGERQLKAGATVQGEYPIPPPFSPLPRLPAFFSTS